MGVITGLSVEEDLENLKRCIHDGEVSRVKRLLKPINVERVGSLSVLFEYQ